MTPLKLIGDIWTKRKAIISIVLIIFSTIASLVPFFVLAAPIFKSNITFKAHDVDTYNGVRGLIATQVLLYVLNRFARRILDSKL